MGHDDVLHQDEDRGYFVGEHVGVGCGCQPFARHGDQIQAARELVEEVGMTCEDIKEYSTILIDLAAYYISHPTSELQGCKKTFKSTKATAMFLNIFQKTFLVICQEVYRFKIVANIISTTVL